ncbi:MAG: T9SS type A sorting domain-containing protein [Crocinitomicaceae bacterium]|nr:T9SS type A sorting domain-containing protein [Crocinitomicaceae bacterium]
MMKYILALILGGGFLNQVAAQSDGVEPLRTNPELTRAIPIPMKAGASFDSTFIWSTDTLEVSLTKSFLDEFTLNHFQDYTPDFGGINTTFDKKYKLLNKTTNAPLANTVKYSNTPTVLKKVNVALGTVINSPLPADTIKVGDFSSYPPVYSTTIVYPAYNIIDTVDFANAYDTLFITDPFFVQDSATQFFGQVSDQNAYWLDKNAYHNYRFAEKPWTLGVVTFDGLDENGYPYQLGSSAVGLADVLHSKPINMSSVSAANEVYFSFLYQTGGFGDEPEAQDSLVLQFYAPDINQWFSVWSAIGAPVSDFKKVHLKVQDAKYFQTAFQFRFMNYGGLSGSLDHFHIDYVHLRANSGAQDTLFKDFAFVYPLGSFLKDYTSVPWDHYKNNPSGKMNDSTQIYLRNGSNITENSQSGMAWVNYNNVQEGTFILTDFELTNQDPATNYAPVSFFESFHDFSTGYRFDENKIGDEQTFDLFATASVPFSQLTINDSTNGQQVFSNYYAYDDGSAEQAYGTTGAQSMVAYQFTPYESDSLIGVNMSFVPTVTDVSNKLFILTVWNDNNGKPGAKIYEDDFFFPRQPKYELNRNVFTNYYLRDTMKLAITGTFYVGWRQLDPERLGIGFDRNTINNDKIFYSVNNGSTWENTTYEGSLLMRPIFSTALDATLGIKETTKEASLFEVYPNPAENVLNFNVSPLTYQGARLFDMQGKLLLEISEKEVQMNISDIRPGMYLVKENASGITRKIIKK